MDIRFAKPEDECIWIALNREFMDFEIQGNSLWNDTEKTPEEVFQNTFHEALDCPEFVTLLIFEEKGEPVGFANLMTIYSVWAHGKALVLDDLFIRKNFRGKGKGRLAMAYIERLAKEQGHKRLQFQSEASNPGARNFYEALRYQANDMYFYVKYL